MEPKTAREAEPGADCGREGNAGGELQECLRSLRDVQQIGKIGIWRREIGSDKLWWSGELFRIFGLDPHAAPPSLEELSRLIHPEDRGAFASQVASHEPHRSRYRVVLPDGLVRHVQEEVRIERDDRGIPVRVCGTAQDVTERQSAEEAFRESEAKYRRLYNETPVLLHSIDRDAVVVDVNDYWLKTLGYERREVIGRKVTDFYTPESRKYALETVLPAFFRDGVVRDIPYRFVKKSGEVIDVLLSATGERDAAGNVVRSQAVVEDISERKRAEEKLQQSQRMLQTIIEAEPECVKVLDRDARLIMMNRAGLDMIQVDSLEQAKGQCVCPMIGTADRGPFMDLTRRVFAGESGTLAFEMVGVKGRRLWLETHAVPLRDEKDAIVALLGVTRDITAQKQAAEALRASESRFRAIIEHAPSGILVADAGTGKFQYGNPVICRMLGYEPEELLNLSVGDIHPSDELTLVRRAFEARAGVKTRCVRKDGTVFPVEIGGMGVELDGGPCIVGFFTDMTERELLEEERLKAQKLESIGTLAGGIAHDFNNLLQGVFGYLSMAKLTLDSRAKSLAMLEQAEKALHQSVSLTTQLLTFSKGGKPVRKVTDLRPVIENAVKFALSGSRVTFALDLAPDLRAVDADEGQIGQVIQNLVLNAEQAMPQGGSVEVSARNAAPAQEPGRSPAAGLVEILVRDQGTGIAAAHLPRIFDPYFTTKKMGSGLGLATAYSIVANHDGTIHVRSDPGKGTTFTVRLPASAAGRARPAAAQGHAPPARCRVLVMDDEEFVRAVAGELLHALGHEAAFAEDGATAVAQYAAARAAGTPFDVVILDLTIRGGMGGEETARRLREIDPGVRAVVSSGYSDDEVAATFRRHGFRAFLKKPYSIADLSRVLAEVLP